MNDFNFQSTIKDTQNYLISQSIRDSSNSQLLKSEDAFKNIIKSYSEKFKSSGGMLLDASKYVVESKTIINKSLFNDLFETIYIDLFSLYNDLSAVDSILTLNLERNKSYVLTIKKRIKDLWNKLDQSRISVFDLSPSDEIYYESFHTLVNSSKLSNLSIDKKMGYIHLEPTSVRTFNNSHQIKNVSSKTYPVEAENGGVKNTTNSLNTLADNYTYGSKDLLSNGLWKEQLICSYLPNIFLNIAGPIQTIYKAYNGIVSIVDIEFTTPIQINRLNIDLFGDFPTLVDTIFYKLLPDDEWSLLNLYNSEEITDSCSLNAVDVISFNNIILTKVKYLRLVFNQQHYTFINSKSDSQSSINDKINNDLTERRYDLVKFGSSINEFLSKPVNDDNISLYNKIIELVESISNVDVLLSKIQDTLTPTLELNNYDFKSSLKFEIGAWSIEPKIEKYTGNTGVYDSNPYFIKDKSLLSVSLKTKQNTPMSSTVNWYIDIGKSYPILTEDQTFCKEPANFISLSNYNNFKDFKNGSFILLNFPINTNNIKFELFNGNSDPIVTETEVIWFNSRLLYLHDILDPYRFKYYVKYIPAKYNSVNLYILNPKSSNTDNIGLSIVSSNKILLEYFIKKVSYSGVLLSDLYHIAPTIATLDECEQWFGSEFSSPIFISNDVYANLDGVDNLYYIINHSYCKSSSVYQNILDSISGIDNEYSDFSIIGSIPNVAPLTMDRSI